MLMVRWLLRSVANQSKRITVLVDAKAVLGAAAKGRSSARALQSGIRKLAALQLGGDVLLRLVYVPSEDNPADAPSRGRRLRGGVRKRLHKRYVSHLAAVTPSSPPVRPCLSRLDNRVIREAKRVHQLRADLDWLRRHRR